MPTIKLNDALRQAQKLASAGRVEEARRVYASVLEVFPGNKTARSALASLSSRGPARGADPARTELEALLALLRDKNFAALSQRIAPLLARYPASANLHNIAGLSLVEQGDTRGAAEAFARVVELTPNSPEGHLNYGSALRRERRWRDAERHVRRAIELRPTYGMAHGTLGGILKDVDLPQDAIPHFERALDLMPGRPEILLDLGDAREAVNDLDGALAAFQGAIDADPGSVQAYARKGVVLRRLLRMAEARACFEEGLKIKPNSGNLHRLLGSVLSYSPGDPHLAAMLALHDDAGLPDEDRCELCFALAKGCEEIKDYESALRFLAEGGAVRKRILGYSAGADRDLFNRIKTATAAIQQARFAPKDAPKVTPIFILGMPRSGTTLVEQIISSHSRVTAGDELEFVERFGLDLARGEKAPTAEALAEFREKYLRSLALLSDGTPFVTDKMPLNFRFIGLIAKALPEAKIVHTRRDARAVCWSNFRRYFPAKGLGYSYDLGDVTAYFHLYRDLMGYWDLVLPGRVHHLDYEQLTLDPEAGIRSLLAHLDLPWEDACLSPERNTRVSRTASTLQVRKPIYKGSSEEWRRYEPFLGGAFDGLETSA